MDRNPDPVPTSVPGGKQFVGAGSAFGAGALFLGVLRGGRWPGRAWLRRGRRLGRCLGVARSLCSTLQPGRPANLGTNVVHCPPCLLSLFLLSLIGARNNLLLALECNIPARPSQ